VKAIHTKSKKRFWFSACTLRKRFTQNQKKDFGSLLALCESDSHKIKKKILILCLHSAKAIHTKSKKRFWFSAFLQVGVQRQVSHAFAGLKFR
jgi:hypothetical protein